MQRASWLLFFFTLKVACIFCCDFLTRTVTFCYLMLCTVDCHLQQLMLWYCGKKLQIPFFLDDWHASSKIVVLAFVFLDDMFCCDYQWRCLMASHFAAFLSWGDLSSYLTCLSCKQLWHCLTMTSISLSIFYNVAISRFMLVLMLVLCSELEFLPTIVSNRKRLTA